MENALINSGKQAFIEENYESALSYFSKALEKDENNYIAHLYRGCTYNKLGDYDNAIDDFNQVQKSGKTHDYLYNRALSHYYNENLSEASKDLNEANEKIGNNELISSLLLKLD
jgi:Flp pilus assembly protein TadD